MEVPNLNLLETRNACSSQINAIESKGNFIPIDAVIRDENASYIWVEKPWDFENVMVETELKEWND
jgi:Cu(I)/Ag(I) efflux system membrane fusion protein